MRHESLADIVHYEGARAFNKSELSAARDIFRDRAALFHTPTQEIPETLIGVGALDVWLPLPVPGLIDHEEIWGFRSPRLWVSLLQRATGKLRWTPAARATVTIDSYDHWDHGEDRCIKAVLDALKASTTGRRDGRSIYYFGALVDDNRRHLAGLVVRPHVVQRTRVIGCRIVVREEVFGGTDGA